MDQESEYLLNIIRILGSKRHQPKFKQQQQQEKKKKGKKDIT